MLRCPDRVDEEAVLVSADQKRIVRQDEGTSLCLNRDALAALEDMRAKEEELADARAAAEAAANEAADKARLAKAELDALKSGDTKALKSFNIKEEDTEKMDDEDLMLPTDLFGDDLFKNLMSGEEIDIDESALDEAEQVEPDAAVAPNSAGKANNELEAGLRDMLGPDFDAKDMEDIFKGMVDPEEKNKIKTEIKSEPTDELPSSVNDTLNELSSQNFESSYSFPAASSATSIKEELISTSSTYTTTSPSTISSTPSSSSSYVSGLPSNVIVKTEAGLPTAVTSAAMTNMISNQPSGANILVSSQAPPPPGAQNIQPHSTLPQALNNQNMMSGIRPIPGVQNMPGSTALQQGLQSMPGAQSLPPQTIVQNMSPAGQNMIRAPNMPPRMQNMSTAASLPPGAQSLPGAPGMISGGQNMVRMQGGVSMQSNSVGLNMGQPLLQRQVKGFCK